MTDWSFNWSFYCRPASAGTLVQGG